MGGGDVIIKRQKTKVKGENFMIKFGSKRVATLITALALVTVGAVYASWTYSSSSAASSTTTVTIGMTDVQDTGTSTSGSYSISRDNGSVYKLDQYSNAVTTVGSTYDYIVLPKLSTMTAASGYIAIVSYNSGDGTFTYVDLDNLVTYVSGTTFYSSMAATASISVYPDYTAAVCITAGASVTLTFTASDATSSAYQYGIDTSYTLSYTAAIPTLATTSVAGDDTYYYYSSEGSDTTVLSIDTTERFIYSTDVTSAPKVWTGNDPTNGTFTYTISTAELASYIKTTGLFVLSDKDAYNAMNDAIGSFSLTFTVAEASDTVLTAPVLAVTRTNDSTATYSITNSAYASESAYIASYSIGLFADTTSGSPVYTITGITASASSTGNDLSTLINGVTTYDIPSGTYYLKVRAITSSSDNATSSVWSADTNLIKVTITNSGDSYTITYAT